ncbi:hypothetical protein BGZ68_001467 [Mortierella alpina]|nr:hypothetical protein BGZ68_001467 [Mortierella alpina]
MSQAPPLNLDTKPKRSVSFLNHDVDTKTDSRLGRSSFKPGRRKGYVRKGPVQSDDESEEGEEEEDEIEEEEEEEEQDQPTMNTGSNNGGYEPATANVSANATANVNFNEINRPISQTLMSKAAVRPGQNYVRKVPVNSDTESETDEAKQAPRSPPSSHGTTSAAKPAVDASDSESDKEKEAGGLVRSFAAARIAGPGQNYVRKAPVNSDTESDEEGSPAASNANMANTIQGRAAAAAALQGQGRPASAIVNQNLANASSTSLNASPVHSRVQSHEAGLLGASSTAANTSAIVGTRSHSPSMAAVATSSATGVAPNLTFIPGVGMTMANTSATSLSNGSSASAQNNLASSMAIYQQQQQEMMLIMQQQQIQIATMQQQQQAYQLLVLQQQQHHQQQLQAVQLQHSRAASSNGSVMGKDLEDDSDDDVPLGEKRQQLPALPTLPELPQFTSLMDTTTIPSRSGTPPLQQPQPVLAGAGPSAAHILMQNSPQLQDARSRQTSVSSIHSVRSGSPNPMMTLPHLHALPLVSSPLNPATSSPLLQQQMLAQQLQQQQQTHAYSEGDLQHPAQQLGPGSLLTSGFPAGYRHSMQSISLGQLNPDRGSVTSLHSIGSNGSSGSGSGSKPNNNNNSGQRHSYMSQSPAQHLQLQQQLLQQQQQQQQQHLWPQQHQTLLQCRS